MKSITLILSIIFMSLSSCNEKYDLEDGIYAEFITEKGVIVTSLDYKEAPATVANFITLAEGKNTFVDKKYSGKPFYDGLKFHRVISDFMIQGGCPLGTGSGDPGYKFDDQISKNLKHVKPGTLSMANSGPNTNGSQFFITHKATTWLDGKHAVFGYTVIGQDIVNTIEKDNILNEVNIIRVGSDAKKFDALKVFTDWMNEIKVRKAEREKAQEEAKKKQLEIKNKINNEIDEIAEGFTKTNSGLRINITKKTNGSSPKAGDKVKVDYVGMFLTDKVFDTSIESVAKKHELYDPKRNYNAGFAFLLGKRQVIPAWDEAISMLKVGEKATIICPPHLAYGERGAGNVIPPNAVLKFDVELKEIVK